MSKRWMIPLGAAILLSLPACQSKKEGLQLACDSPNRVDGSLPPAARGQALASYVEDHVTNGEVLALLAGEEPRQEKAKKLEAMAKSEGLQECALAKLWATPPTPPRPPMSAIPAMPRLPVPPASGSAAPPGGITVTGGLTAEQVSSVIDSHRDKMSDCYKAGLRRNKELTGKIEVRFVVGPDGKVKEAREQQGAFPDPDVVRCIVTFFENLTFPKPQEDEAVVVFPLTLKVGT